MLVVLCHDATIAVRACMAMQFMHAFVYCQFGSRFFSGGSSDVNLRLDVRLDNIKVHACVLSLIVFFI